MRRERGCQQACPTEDAIVKKVEQVKLVDRFARSPAVGNLYLTATHLIFVDQHGRKETWILHMHMNSVEKLALTTGGSPLQIRCKNFRNITFVIPRERDCHDIYNSLLEMSRPSNIESLYAFSFSVSDGSPKSHGWDLYDLQTEYLRQGVPNEHWVLSNQNKDYELCDTYPSKLYLPASASTPIIVGSSKFRSRGRLPALSYLHRENQAAITRCSQPLAGFSARCVEDEAMLQAVLRSNPGSTFMYVVDTRPKINAIANQAKGKGYEKEANYSNMKFKFLGIENIHVMRNSLQKLLEVCELKNPSMNAFLSGLENSGWLKHIRAILETSCFIAQAIASGTSVLVHCSDGWDRTAQTCSLASLLLDPYYRTVQGFQALVEKEWLSFGHKFTDRCGFLDTVDSKEVSPVFTQFLDSVWQVMQQFPCAFQFNERFLVTLHDHAFSCQFGTFIGNCEKDRLDLRLRERTYSLWAELARQMPDFVNPLYRKEYEISHPILRPNICPQFIKFWRGMYNRFDNGLHPREHTMDTLSAARDHSHSLEDHVTLLEKRVTQICTMLGKSEDIIARKLQGYLSMDSLDGVLAGHIEDGNLPSKGYSTDRSNSADNNDLSPVQAPGKSDTESGFDESSSQLSRSGNEELVVDPCCLVRSPSSDSLTLDQLLAEITSVGLDWRSFRNVHNCNCATPFDHNSKKHHCWRCGEVFCTRCIARHMPLPGHYSRRRVPVCKPCSRALRQSQTNDLPTS